MKPYQHLRQLIEFGNAKLSIEDREQLKYLIDEFDTTKRDLKICIRKIEEMENLIGEQSIAIRDPKAGLLAKLASEKRKVDRMAEAMRNVVHLATNPEHLDYALNIVAKALDEIEGSP